MVKTSLLAAGVVPVVLLVLGTALSAATAVKDTEPIKVCDGLEFPEGPAYDGRGNLYVSNCNSDYITKVAADGTVTRKWMTASAGKEPLTYQKTNGMAFYKDGSLFACDFGRKAIIRIHPSKRCEVYADKCDTHPFKGPNDLAFDRRGNLYFTDPTGSGRKSPIGCLYMAEAGTRKVRKLADGMAFPNGVAFSPDGKRLYVCESQYNRILRFPVKADGTLGKKEAFVDLSPAGQGEPDGMAVDSKGRLWITHYGAHQVVIVDSGGKIERTIKLPYKHGGGPTNIEFAGPDMKNVYITDPGDDCLWKMQSDVAGLPLFSAPANR
jgi:gluconolactonase